MELEILEMPIAEDSEASSCEEGGNMIGCCIIHFWNWDPGHGLCC